MAMLRVLLATTRPETLHSFIEGLFSDPEVWFDQVGSGRETLEAVRSDSPHLVIIDSGLPDTEALKLAPELLMVNAMVNTAVVSSLSDQEFHDAAEGLGVLTRLPIMLGKRDATELLHKLRVILGLVVS
jgi:DNA-binding response OmpR family regulator